MSDHQWKHIATEITAATGIAPHDDLSAARWIGIRHADNHIHIVATLVRQDRRTVWPRSDYRRCQACCRYLEQHYQLHRVHGHHANKRLPTPAELNKTTRQHREEVPRHQLRRAVHAAADASTDEQDFLDRLRASGLLVRPRTDPTNPTQLTGYAVALPEDHNAAGDTIWYSGSTLAADLSLPQLHRRWQTR
ncbi:hypothetical protein ACN27G_29030 [Plantactinospora sp. WMMB334]|uniref:hypothetical protein n=1 Tax=Plantactinospora sp. WMMB334 TaxID=3404119 RepID=UPI003B924728